MTPPREILPPRREQLTETLLVGRGEGNRLPVEVSVGFDPTSGQPREVFLCGAKDGSDRAFELANIAVALSVALQSGVSAAAMAHSVARLPSGEPVTATGAALDLLAQYERGEL